MWPQKVIRKRLPGGFNKIIIGLTIFIESSSLVYLSNILKLQDTEVEYIISTFYYKIIL